MIRFKCYKNSFVLLCVLSYLFLVNHLTAQEQLVVQTIQFDTLKKTNPDYLKRFIDTRINKTTTLTQLRNDVQQLKNLNNIATADYQIDTIDQQLHITYSIEEALTLFPIINFGGIEGNFWFQLGFNELNWLGKGTIP